MSSSRSWLRASVGIVLPLLMMACEGGDGGQGGAGGAAGGQGGAGGAAGGQGGTGGGAMALAADGLAQDDCAPDDGPALAMNVGTANACGMPGDDAPQARFLAYPGAVDMLAPGDKWSYVVGDAGELSIGWFPSGASGSLETPKSGQIEVISATATTVEVKYSFETMAGDQYAGTAVLDICDSTPLCG